MTITETLKELFLRELQKLEDEIAGFPDEAMLWKTSGDIKNSAGNLCLHLCGNIQHFIGAYFGNTGYARNRDAEFSSRNIAKEKLIEEIKQSKQAIEKAFAVISTDDLKKIYPQNFMGKEVTADYFIIHLISHFDYHLGQINYLRRFLLKS